MELTLLLGLVAALSGPAPVAAAETVLGVYVFHRHGDRTAKAWSPVNLTALGADEVFASGSYYRARYVAASAAQKITALSSDLAVLGQLAITSPVDTVLESSANVFAQALYPPAGAAAAQTLANGSTVEPPLGGYQYVPVNAVTSAATSQNAENNEWLQGGSGCGNAVVSSNNYFYSNEYAATYNATLDFYRGLEPVINGTYGPSAASFKNGYTIYDLIHVATIHNASINASDLLTTPTLHQLQTLADQHEWNLAYNASDPVRAIAGSVLAGQVLQALNASLSAKSSASPRLNVQFGAYGTFMAFFGLAQLPAVSPDFMGIVDYASSMAFELVTNSTAATPPAASDVSVRFLFANGSASDANPLVAYPLFGGQADTLSWPDFVSGMQKFAVEDTASWCKACGNSTGACAGANAATGTGTGPDASPTAAGGTGGSAVSSPVAGVIGALVTLAVILGIEALVLVLFGLRLVKKSALGGAAPAEGSAPKTAA